MKIKLHRTFKGDSYTIGKLYLDGEYFCDTIEDKDRGLFQNMPLEQIKEKKIKYQTAIPTGTYKVTLSVQSPKFSQKEQYNFCNGYLPRLIDVPGFEGILIHIGNTAEHSGGCILVGENKVKGKVINSTATFKKLYKRLKSATDEITIDIV